MEESIFVSELKGSTDYMICNDEFDAFPNVILQDRPSVQCPACKSGQLNVKNSQHGTFVGCNNFPYCEYKERACPQCRQLMTRDRTHRKCTNSECDAVIQICQKCGADMVKRTGRYGEFWGCSNYRKNAAHFCTNTAKIP
jgi:DNA helicase-4